MLLRGLERLMALALQASLGLATTVFLGLGGDDAFCHSSVKSLTA